MKWKVGPVNRVVKQAPDDWDFDTLGAEVPEDQLSISYNVGVEGIVSESQIRAEVRTFLMKITNMIMMKWIFSSLQLQDLKCGWKQMKTKILETITKNKVELLRIY